MEPVVGSYNLQRIKSVCFVRTNFRSPEFFKDGGPCYSKLSFYPGSQDREEKGLRSALSRQAK